VVRIDNGDKAWESRRGRYSLFTAEAASPEPIPQHMHPSFLTVTDRKKNSMRKFESLRWAWPSTQIDKGRESERKKCDDENVGIGTSNITY